MHLCQKLIEAVPPARAAIKATELLATDIHKLRSAMYALNPE
jgi:hypothetical protein